MESLLKERLRVVKLFDLLDVESILASVTCEMAQEDRTILYSIDNIAVALGDVLQSILKDCVERAINDCPK